MPNTATLMREAIIRTAMRDLEEVPFTIGEEGEWFYQDDEDGDDYDSNDAYCDSCDTYYCSCGSCACDCVECDRCGCMGAPWAACDVCEGDE